jgi:hypothetical protein
MKNKLILTFLSFFLLGLLSLHSCKKKKDAPSAEQLKFIGSWKGISSCVRNQTINTSFYQGSSNLSIYLDVGFSTLCTSTNNAKSYFDYGTISGDTIIFQKQKFLDDCDSPIYLSAIAYLSADTLIYIDTLIGGIYHDSAVCISTLTKQ